MENELKMHYVDPSESIGPGLGTRIWKSRDEMKEYFPDQPKRSKREDDIMYLKCACGEYKHVFLDKIHMSRCGTLNTDESQ
jgi:hypothetical protein